MGGDSPPQAIFEAVLAISKEINPPDALVVIAQHSILPELRRTYAPFSPSITFITTEEAIEMEDAPLLAIRRKKDSSLAAGMRLLNEKKIDAFVTTGNTGALVALAMHHLNKLPHIERPALLIQMPTEKGSVTVLDVGANIAPKPHHLLSYALLGSLYRQLIFHYPSPMIGLLNVGVEEQKGTKEIKEAYRLLQEKFPRQFVGNVEGREVFQGKIDVLVTDGFTGNVFLKTSEGISSFLAEYLKKHFEVPHIVSHLYNQFNYSKHPGAFLCGVDGVIVKCHGFSDRTSLINGIKGAFSLVNAHIIPKLTSQLQNADDNESLS